jgi:hypothetical protein
MRWLCIFLPHKWEHVINIKTDKTVDIRQIVGLYQCKRCQKISKGTEIRKNRKFCEKKK